MPSRLRPLPPDQAAAHESAYDAALSRGEAAAAEDVRALVRHYLALLGTSAPGRSVEVRVPPYAAVQCVAGSRHTRGTPPAVVEADAETWLAVARGRLAFTEAVAAGRIRASGERSDLTPHLPLA